MRGTPAVRRQIDPTLYLITDTVTCGGASGVLAVVRAAVEGGATAVQLRDPGADTRELVDLGSALMDALRPTGVPLVVNDRIDVALAIGAQGAHVGQSDLDPVAARRLLGPSAHLGVSVGNPGQALAACRLPDGVVDLLGVGPVHPTSSKPDAAPPIGLEGLAAVCAVASLPCVAIGGLQVGDVRRVREAGAMGLAVISALCASPDPRRDAAAFVAAWRGVAA